MNSKYVGVGISLGLCFGVALGAASQHVGLGMALGVSLGTAFGAALARKKGKAAGANQTDRSLADSVPRRPLGL